MDTKKVFQKNGRMLTLNTTEAQQVVETGNTIKKMPDAWQVKYKNLTFNIKPMGFKHTGLFPEQAVNWDWMIEKIQKKQLEK